MREYIKNIKAIKKQIEEYINIPNQQSTISIPCLKLTNHQVNFEFKEKSNSINVEFKIPTNLPNNININEPLNDYKECIVKTKNNEYYSNKCLFKKYNITHATLNIHSLKNTLEEPETTKYIEVCYFEKKVNINNYINSYSWKSGNGFHSYFIPLTIDRKEFHMYPISFDQEDNLIIVIECLEDLPLDVFQCYSLAVKRSLGFIIGYFSGDKSYFMGSKNKFKSVDYFQALSMENTSKLDFTFFISSNHFLSKKISLNKGIPLHLSIEQFEKLCGLCYSDMYIFHTISAVYESTKVSLDTIPYILVIALEMLKNSTEIKSTDQPEQPINNPILWKNLRKIFLTVLDDFEKENSNFDIIRKKINNLNNPLNTNQLLAPFETFNIDLLDDEKKMIEKRNKLLHGKLNVEDSLQSNISPDIGQMYKENLIYYHLIYCLILKVIGYNGAIINIRSLDYIKELTNENISRYYIILDN